MSTIKTNIIEPLGSSLTISGNASAVSFTGNGTIPVGGIILWSGSIASIPANWQLCNGTNGTPDLRNTFVVGAAVDSSGEANTTITTSTTKTGGSKDAVLVSHSHFVANTDSIGGSSSFGTLNSSQTMSRTVGSGSGSDFTYGLGGTTTTATVGNTNTAGSSATNANLPPYYALAYIMRIA